MGALGQPSLSQSSTFSHRVKKDNTTSCGGGDRSSRKKSFAESVRDPVTASWRWSLGRERQVALPDDTGTDSSPDHHLRLLPLFGDGFGAVNWIGDGVAGWQGSAVRFLPILVGSFVQNRL